MNTKHTTAAAMAIGVGMLAGLADAQSLYLTPTPTLVTGETIDASAPLRDVSLIVVTPPEPHQYKKHDLVEIIINQSTTYKLEQSLDAKKKYDLSAELSQFPSLRHLLEAQLVTGDSNPVVKAGANATKNFKGDGKRESKDEFTARISAEVLDVKPNGNIVLEAKETIQKDGEIKTMVLSGVCRQQDVTESNTIQSSKLANLTIRLQYDGPVHDTSEKGVIAQVLDTIFAF